MHSDTALTMNTNTTGKQTAGRFPLTTNSDLRLCNQKGNSGKGFLFLCAKCVDASCVDALMRAEMGNGEHSCLFPKFLKRKECIVSLEIYIFICYNSYTRRECPAFLSEIGLTTVCAYDIILEYAVNVKSYL